jgi:hypothetical protein
LAFEPINLIGGSGVGGDEAEKKFSGSLCANIDLLGVGNDFGDGY